MRRVVNKLEEGGPINFKPKFLSISALSQSVRGASSYVRRFPQLGLAGTLFFAGITALAANVAALAGALFGAGATLLGAWINELNSRRAAAEAKLERQSEARQYLAPELHRAILRILFIHGRASVNFGAASAEQEIKPNDAKQDFLPSWPVLYPDAQVHQLSGEDAVALIAFYDSLHFLSELVNGWWEREGQLPVNIFNAILQSSGESLTLALVCVENFELERLYPPQNEAIGTISSRIDRSLSIAAKGMEGHLARSAAKAENNAGHSQRRTGQR